jgi:hypothetical protein
MARMQKSGRRKQSLSIGWVPTGVCSAHLVVLAAGAVLLFRACRPRPGPEYVAVLGLGALTIALIPWFGSRGVQRNWAGWALAALMAGGFASVAATSGSKRLALLGLTAFGLSCAFNAIGVTVLSRSARSSSGPGAGRGAAACAVGGLLLVAVLAGALGGPRGAAFPSLLAIFGVVAFGLRSFALEPLARVGPPDRATACARDLLGGAWLGTAAIAAASLAGTAASVIAMDTAGQSSPAGWATAELVGRLGWWHALPVAGMSLVVFARRIGLAGMGALSAGGKWLGLGLAAGLSLGVGHHVLAQERERLQAQAGSPGDAGLAELQANPEAVQPATPTASSPPADATSTPAPAASAPTAPEPDTAAVALVKVESVAVAGTLQSGIVDAVERRRSLLESCARRGGLEETGTLSVRVIVAAGGGAASVVPTGGELAGTPLGDCMLRAFYHMGFPPPVAKPGTAVITLRVAPTR